MNYGNNFLSFYALLIIISGIYNVYTRNKANRLLTAVTGLHVTFIMFFGFGFLAYANFDIQKDVIGREEILSKIDKIIPYLLTGYMFITILEYRRMKIDGNKDTLYNFDFKSFDANVFLAIFLLIGYCGLVFSQLAIANSSIGTFFPVFNNFIYPVSILIIVKFDRKNKFSVILLCLLFILVGLDAFISAWRSQLIMFSASILIALSIRGRLNYWVLGVIGIIYCFFILPFQQLKKQHYIDYNNDPVETFKASFDYDIEKRIEIFANFLAERINYTREMAYVQSALDNNRLENREGETYVEVLYQLIPRIFWKDKPSYNQFTGFEIPRRIQLLQWADLSTSWAVNSFAEFLYNFSYQFLPVFSVLLYLFLAFLDNLVDTLKLYPEYNWFLHATLFFLSLNLVSVIYSSTYFLWSFIVIYVFNWVKKIMNTDEGIIIRGNI